MCTERERQILREIVECIQSKGYPPSVRELVDAMGAKSTAGMVDHLRKLQRKGLIEREVATARALRLTPAGQAALAVETCDET